MNLEKITQELPGFVFGCVMGACTVALIYSVKHGLWFAGFASWAILSYMTIITRGLRKNVQA